MTMKEPANSDEDEDSEVDVDDTSSDADTAITEGSFVKVVDNKATAEDALNDANDTEPDIYNVNVVAWDVPVSALHVAILGGHTEVINVLVDTFGADVLLPVKIIDAYSRNPKAAIMTLVLAAQLSGSTALGITRELLALGASSAQGDIEHVTALHYLVAKQQVQLLKACFEEDGAASTTALDHLTLHDAQWRPKSDTPLITAIRSGNSDLVNALLDFGAKPFISLDDFAAAYSLKKESSPSFMYPDEDVSVKWKKNTEQPVLLAVESNMPEAIVKMVDAGADINTIDNKTHEAIERAVYDSKHAIPGGSLLDAVKARIASLKTALSRELGLPEPVILEDDQVYLEGTDPRSYERWFLSKIIEVAKNAVKEWKNCITKTINQEENRHVKQQRNDELKALLQRFVSLREQISQRGAKTFEELHPDVPTRKHEKDEKIQQQDESFKPAVSFKVSTTDKVREGYLQL